MHWLLLLILVLQGSDVVHGSAQVWQDFLPPGVIQPSPETLPIPIHGAHSYFTFFPLEQRLQFDEL